VKLAIASIVGCFQTKLYVTEPVPLSSKASLTSLVPPGEIFIISPESALGGKVTWGRGRDRIDSQPIAPTMKEHFSGEHCTLKNGMTTERFVRPMMQRLRFLHLGFVLLLQGALWAGDKVPSESIDFNRDVRPILAENCLACHGFDPAHREAGLRLDTFEGATEDRDGSRGIAPGNLDQSQLWQRITSMDSDEVMPPPGSQKPPLNATQKEVLKRWIEQGAKYDRHWAFEPPQRPAPPEVPGAVHPIDRFIQARLLEEAVPPSPVAELTTLIRRVSLDLTGLPPTPAQVDAFLQASHVAPDAAYLELVDELLRSPHYGERWGRWWLDQARYADSNGYSIDAPRQIWKYRDWVVEALNADMPFDRFTIEQLAGDLLPDATESQRIATGFHRNTQINEEGGIDKEQFRIDSVFDRVATTGTVWLGLTVGCAQCHDHKFDPIEQKEFYQLFAFFNNQDEPSMKVLDSEGVTTMVLAERPTPRQTTIFIKGDFTRPAEEVLPGTPDVLHPFQAPEGYPNRLHLAQWLVSPQNPLTARVIVNRLWQQLFGRGIVETENDFGTQGTSPSHPELLDWLATEFVARQWSLKEMHRMMVTSHTYRQSSTVRPEVQARDPQNYLLARQQRLRLDAEVVRDVALVASGLFSPKLGGPPVYPPIPDGVMSQGQVKRVWAVSQGADQYRRGLYTFLYRGSPPPSLNVFDAPDGVSTCTRRLRSNTPLQALTLMNDSAYFEFAVALEKLIQNEGLTSAFRRCTSREPDPEELAILTSLDPLNAARALLNLDETITRE
jgi:hypothetical protein